jgi:thiol-disulfide isomerase/thioredoxin
MLSRFKQYDLYRRIPKDLTETSAFGAVLSLCAVFFMAVLFAAELWAFLYSPVSTNVILDPNNDQSLRINFNITLLEIPCEYASIVVVDVLGTRKEDFTFGSYLNKWTVDPSGTRSVDRGYNHELADLEHDEHNLDELYLNGVHVLPLDGNTFNRWIGDHTYTFVNFHSPWCSWCKLLEPVWEAFAERVVLDTIPVSVVQVDCIANGAVCEEQNIHAFPTLRLYKNGVVQSPDYRSDRTVDAFIDFAKSRLAKDEALSHLLPHEKTELLEKEKNVNLHHHHPGCMLIGNILVNRWIDSH